MLGTVLLPSYEMGSSTCTHRMTVRNDHAFVLESGMAMLAMRRATETNSWHPCALASRRSQNNNEAETDGEGIHPTL